MIERTFIQQNIKKLSIETYLKRNLDKAGFTGLKMSKTPLVTRIVLNVTRPGLAIGKKGKNIRMLTKDLEEKFGIDNPQIEIQEITKPELNARATISKITSLLERGYSWRSVSYRTTEAIMAAGAQGVELVLKGKLAGKGGRKRKERIAVGYMKKAGAQSELVEYAKGDAYPKAGAIGVKLRIIKPDTVFPDKVNIKTFCEEKAEEEKKEEEKEEKEGKEKEEEKAGEKEKEEMPKENKEEKKAEEKKEKKEEKPAEKEKEGAPAEEKKESKAEKKKEKPVKEKKVKDKAKVKKKEEKGKEEKKKEEPEKKDEKVEK